MSNIVITKEVTGKKGRYVGRIDGIEGEAQIIFEVLDASTISADHTLSPPSMRGTGAAFDLVTHMVADARENGFKVRPICPYIKAQYKKHPEWQDVMTVPPEA